MKNLNENDIKYIVELLKQWETLPVKYKEVLFGREIEKKEYELKYAGKEREEDIIANTYASPLQKVKTYNPDSVIDHKEFVREPETKDQFVGRYNKLIFWDNLQVLKTLLTDELLQKQIKENWGIKLIYIDPPFATKSDFSVWKWEKAYTDKIAWAEFIEFIRKRLILMKNLLSDDGSIYVHLDEKKHHYIKVILDEIFWESNFQREIIRDISVLSWFKTIANNWIRWHDTILFYSKSGKNLFNKIMQSHTDEYLWSFKKKDEDGRLYMVAHGKKRYLDEVIEKWKPYWDVWGDIKSFQQQPTSSERISYPTQKPETLLERIIKASSNEWDIVLDAFAWSWTTLAVAEKLWRKWIGVDGGKLSIYTIQNRLMNLKKEIGNKWELLKPQPFAVYNAGLYDFEILKNLDWKTYIWFTLSLFQCKEEEHKIDWIKFDGKLQWCYVQVFDYNHGRKWISLDRWYLENIDDKIWTKLWKRVYIIAPATKIDGILEDVVTIWGREYFLLRVPYSIIKELYTKDFEKIKQPTSEDDVNNTVEAVWFDFIRVPKVWVTYTSDDKKAYITIDTFESKVISNKKLDYKNLETLSTVIIDYDYNGEYVNFEEVIFADKIKKNDYVIELPKDKIKRNCMIIYIDIFGNEKKEIITIDNFTK